MELDDIDSEIDKRIAAMGSEFGEIDEEKS